LVNNESTKNKLHKVNLIETKIDYTSLESDFQKYINLAKELGATHIKILSSQEVIMDYRAYMKCMIPRCRFYDTNAQCPPHGPSFEQTKQLINCFSHALLVGMQVPVESVIAHNNYKKELLSTPESIAARRKMLEIVSKIEAQAFYDGYYFATAYGGGSCKGTLCSGVSCTAIEKGESCRHPLQSRPSMEGSGMDVFRMVANAGWVIYPVGSCTDFDHLQYGMRVGLVLIC